MVTLFLLELLFITHYTSVKALISVQPPMIIRQPGQTLSIECNSSSNATVEWTLPNNVVRYGTRFFIIESVTSDDSGVYKCSVSGESASTDVFIC